MIFITSAAKPVTAAASDAAAAHSLYLCWVIVWDFNMWRQKCHWERDVGKQKGKEGLDRRTRSHTGRNMNWLRTCEEDWRVIWQILWRSEARKVKWLSDETVWQGYRVCGDLTTNDLIPWMTTAWVDCSSLGCRVKKLHHWGNDLNNWSECGSWIDSHQHLTSPHWEPLRMLR